MSDNCDLLSTYYWQINDIRTYLHTQWSTIARTYIVNHPGNNMNDITILMLFTYRHISSIMVDVLMDIYTGNDRFVFDGF